MERKNNHFWFTRIRVNDLEGSADFYTTVCQLQEMNRVSGEVDGKKYSEVMFLPTSENGTAFVLISIEGEHCESSKTTTIGFMTDDIHNFMIRAKAANGTVVRAVKDVPAHAVKIAFLADPEGNQLEVVQKVPPGLPRAS
jgi:predicted enzyme related to lactoylglutathione lyase